MGTRKITAMGRGRTSRLTLVNALSWTDVPKVQTSATVHLAVSKLIRSNELARENFADTFAPQRFCPPLGALNTWAGEPAEHQASSDSSRPSHLSPYRAGSIEATRRRSEI